MITVIVSAPHSKCIPTATKRLCDSAAGIASELFCQAAEAYHNLDCIHFPATEYRTDHDLNRKPSRKTPYRTELTEAVKQAKQPCVTIDVHSFPNYYLEEAGDINFFKKDELPPEVVILQGPMDRFKHSSLSNTIWKTLVDNGVRSKIIRGITVNDIMNASSEHSVPGVLLEFNEGFSEATERLYQICLIITQVLSRM